MSVENIKRFYDELAKDEALQNRFKTLAKKYEGLQPDEGQLDDICEKELLPFAKSAGYDFTLEELRGYGRDVINPGMRQLSEEELASVAGGSCLCVFVGVGDNQGVSCVCVLAGFGGDIHKSILCVCYLGGAGQ